MSHFCSCLAALALSVCLLTLTVPIHCFCCPFDLVCTSRNQRTTQGLGQSDLWTIVQQNRLHQRGSPRAITNYPNLCQKDVVERSRKRFGTSMEAERGRKYPRGRPLVAKRIPKCTTIQIYSESQKSRRSHKSGFPFFFLLEKGGLERDRLVRLINPPLTLTPNPLAPTSARSSLLLGIPFVGGASLR